MCSNKDYGNKSIENINRHISWECKCKFDGRKYNSNQWLNNNKYQGECKKRHVCKKDYISNHATYSCKNGNYGIFSVMEYSAITYDKIIESYNEEIRSKMRDLIRSITKNSHDCDGKCINDRNI